jgi:hypothetical protein
LGVATALIVAGAVAAAGAAASAAAKKRAADKAAGAQKKALTGQKKILEEELGYSKVNQASVQAERNRAKERIRLQEEIDPELAELRKLGKQQLLEQAQKPGASQQSVQVANQLFGEFIKPDANLEKLKDQLISKAQEDLAAGATLPPEYQAELVRAGLQQGSQAGLRTTQKTIGGPVAQALGSAGLNLERARTQEAAGLAGTASDLTTSRARLLESIFPTISQSEATQRQNAAATFGIGEQTLPQAGLTGQEAANLQINKGNTLMKIRGKRGAISAQQALAKGEATAAYIGAGTQFATSAIGAYGGGGGMGGTGAAMGQSTPAYYGNTAGAIQNLRNAYV